MQELSNSNDRLLKSQASSRVSQRRGSPRPLFPERSLSTVLLVVIGLFALVNCSTGGLQSHASCAHGQRSSACKVIASEAPLPEGASRDGWGGVQRGITAAEYRASENERGLQAPNRAHGLRTWFEATGIRVHDRGAMGGDSLVDLSLAGLGRAAALRPIGPGVVRHAGARVEIERPGVTEWYENSARGLEQSFTLEQAPSGVGPGRGPLGPAGA